MKSAPNQNATRFVFILFSLVFVLLAVIGGFRTYSPVPFWDMWDGYLGFYVKISSGEWSAWWAQHNEHRVLLARIFFWADIAMFQGTGWFLILVNYILMALVCVIFMMAWREYSNRRVDFYQYFLIAWLFSWPQENNLTWGFQSQFILAQLLPLASFYLLHKSAPSGRHSHLYFIASTLLGILSIGSMANGVLTLPILTVFSILARIDWRRCLLLGSLSILCILFYFDGYVSPGGHGSLLHTLKDNPGGLIEYILVYMGGPFYYFLGKGSIGFAFAGLAGGTLILTSAVLGFMSLRNPKQSTLQLAMLSFIVYAGGTAFGTAGGRLIFGVDQALSSRYMTPVLMTWAALMVLSTPYIANGDRRKINSFFLTLLVVMLPQQLATLKSKRDILFERSVAALAIEMGVKDEEQIHNIFPNADWVLAIAKEPIEKNISIFGLPPLVDLRGQIGQQTIPTKSPDRHCKGSIELVQEVRDSHGFFRIKGWVFDPDGPEDLGKITLLNGDGKLVGAALTGMPRPDVGLAVGNRAKYSGFKGYFRPGDLVPPIFRYGAGLTCRLSKS